MALACGVGGGPLGALGSGAEPCKMVLNDVCPRRCALLEKRFPCARVIPGDISKKEVQQQLLVYEKAIDVLEMSLNCQPSSDAASVHDPLDKRHELNDVAVILLLKTARESLERSEVSDHDLVLGNYAGGLALIGLFDSVMLIVAVYLGRSSD